MNRHVTENVTFTQSSNVGGGNYKREVSRKIVGRCGGFTVPLMRCVFVNFETGGPTRETKQRH